MRISDWSSDVCSSDLGAAPGGVEGLGHAALLHAGSGQPSVKIDDFRLDRIVVRRNRAAVPSDHVNPIYFKRVEQVHRVGGSPPAIQSDPDLLYAVITAATAQDRKSTRLNSSH